MGSHLGINSLFRFKLMTPRKNINKPEDSSNEVLTRSKTPKKADEKEKNRNTKNYDAQPKAKDIKTPQKGIITDEMSFNKSLNCQTPKFLRIRTRSKTPKKADEKEDNRKSKNDDVQLKVMALQTPQKENIIPDNISINKSLNCQTPKLQRIRTRSRTRSQERNGFEKADKDDIQTETQEKDNNRQSDNCESTAVFVQIQKVKDSINQKENESDNNSSEIDGKDEIPQNKAKCKFCGQFYMKHLIDRHTKSGKCEIYAKYMEYDSDMYAKCKFCHQSKAHRRNIHLLYKHFEAKHKNEMSNKTTQGTEGNK